MNDKLVLNQRTYNNSRLLKCSSLKVAKDLDYIKYLEISIEKINSKFINNSKYGDLFLENEEFLFEYSKYKSLLNKFIAYSKNELQENSKDVKEVKCYMNNNINNLFESLLTEKEVIEANSMLNEFSSYSDEDIRNYIYNHYDQSVYSKLNLQESYLLIILCDKYINDLNKINNDKINKQIKLKRNLKRSNDLYN